METSTSSAAPIAQLETHPAFKTWDDPTESLESVESRIHDGVPREALKDRATGYINTFARLFPWTLPQPGARIMEVGSGLGYLMEAADSSLKPSAVVGLDVAPNMIDKAQRRLARSGLKHQRLSFRSYDGISIPFDDASFDFVYSAAAIQHIPKPYAYNLFLEIKRILKPDGFAALHMLSFSHLTSHIQNFPFKEECLRQIRNEVNHWHFFYSKEELRYVLSAGVGAGWVSVIEENGSVWSSFGKDRQVEFCNDTILDAER